MKNKEQKKHPNIVFIISSAICFILLIAFCINVFSMKDSVIIPQCYTNTYEQITALTTFVFQSLEELITFSIRPNAIIQKCLVFSITGIITTWLVMTLVVYIKSRKSNDMRLHKKLNILSIGTKIFLIVCVFFLILLLLTPWAIKTKVDMFLGQRDFELPTTVIDGESKNIVQMKYCFYLSGNSHERFWDFSEDLYYYKKHWEGTWLDKYIINGQTFNENKSQKFINVLNDNNLFKEYDYENNGPNHEIVIEGIAGWSVTLVFADGSQKTYNNSKNWDGSYKWENVFNEYFETKLK